MAQRSTRNRIRYAVRQAKKYLLLTSAELKHAHDLAEDRSPILNAALPAVVGGLVEVGKLLEEIYERL
jgi:hypothetical protein